MDERTIFKSLQNRGDVPGLIGPLDAKLDILTRAYFDLPLSVPGASAGALAVNDICNRLLARGATPRFLTGAFVMSDSLAPERAAEVAEAARAASVQAEAEFASVDTEVSDRGPRYGLGMTLTAVGEMRPDNSWSPDCLLSDDAVILTGPAGAHCLAELEAAEGFLFVPPVVDDSASLGDVVHALERTVGSNVRMMYYPAEGVGPAAEAIERLSGARLDIDADAVPVKKEVRAAAATIGMSIMRAATSGAMIVVVAREVADEALAAIRRSEHGRYAAVVGYVV